MSRIEFGIEGIGIWSPQVAGWDALRMLMQSNESAVAVNTRAAPGILPPTERRRAPEAVLIAVEAAQQACAMAQCEARMMPHVFASSYGDLAINHYLCATVADEPREMSPIRFHNSVHNASAGYWAIATGCMASSTAASAGSATFGAGLLEAALIADAESRPALLVAYDVAAEGPLRDLVACRTPFAVALVLAPQRKDGNAWLHIALDHSTRTPVELAPAPSLLHACHRDNPASDSLPLLSALARGEAADVNLAAGPHLNLHVEISF
jgi:Beta-ketoacyl synthase, N-terminal domain